MSKDDEIRQLRELLTRVISDFDSTMTQIGCEKGTVIARYPLPPPVDEITDARLEWLENMHTLHNSVEILYVVTGYILAHIHHDIMVASVESDTLQGAIDKAISHGWVPRKRP